MARHRVDCCGHCTKHVHLGRKHVTKRVKELKHRLLVEGLTNEIQKRTEEEQARLKAEQERGFVDIVSDGFQDVHNFFTIRKIPYLKILLFLFVAAIVAGIVLCLPIGGAE